MTDPNALSSPYVDTVVKLPEEFRIYREHTANLQLQAMSGLDALARGIQEWEDVATHVFHAAAMDMRKLAIQKMSESDKELSDGIFKGYSDFRTQADITARQGVEVGAAEQMQYTDLETHTFQRMLAKIHEAALKGTKLMHEDYLMGNFSVHSPISGDTVGYLDRVVRNPVGPGRR